MLNGALSAKNVGMLRRRILLEVEESLSKREWRRAAIYAREGRFCERVVECSAHRCCGVVVKYRDKSDLSKSMPVIVLQKATSPSKSCTSDLLLQFE